MADDIHFTIDRDKLWRFVCKSDGTYQIIRNVADNVASAANAMSAGYKTGKYHREHKSPGVGGSQPVYESNTQRPKGVVPVGIVYTRNYAAMKENHEHNTLLKSLTSRGGA